MNAILSKTAMHAILALALGAGFAAGTAQADDRREHERHDSYRSSHWIYDDRHHHGHYYPAVGYVIKTMPPGHVAVRFGNRRLFFQAGVWYEQGARGFAVVRPPTGVIVPMLPPGHVAVPVAGMTYYYANDTYYSAAPGGYAVAIPPAAATYIEAPASPPPAPQPRMVPVPAVQPAPQAPGATWYYCASARAYYPYVATCAEGWNPVPASPAPQ